MEKEVCPRSKPFFQRQFFTFGVTPPQPLSPLSDLALPNKKCAPHGTLLPPQLLYQARRLPLRQARMGSHRLAQITDAQRQRDLRAERRREVPKDWSMTATNIVTLQKYLHGKVNTASPERETGVRQLVTTRGRNHSQVGIGPEATSKTSRGQRNFPTNWSTSSSPVRRLPNSAAEYGSTWVAATSSPTPTLATGTDPQTQQVEFGITGYSMRSRSAPPAL